MQTSADNCRDKAKENLQDAKKNLAEIVINEVWGYDDYSKEYQDKLFDALLKIKQILKDL